MSPNQLEGQDVQLSNGPSRRNWTKWEIATVVYAISLLLYIVGCFLCGSTEMRTEIGTLVFSIIPVYIVLFWSLDEARKGTNEQVETLQKLTLEQIRALKNSTKIQTESFSTQSQGIVLALEKVVGAIGQMSEDIRSQMEEEEKRLAMIQKQNEDRLRALEREAQKDLEKKQRIVPRLFVRIADERWLLFFRHYRLYAYNTGGPLRNMKLTFFFSNPSYKTAKRTVLVDSLGREQKSRSIDCGDVPALDAYTAIEVSVSLRDKEERLYVGTVKIAKSNRDWMRIELEERPGK